MVLIIFAFSVSESSVVIITLRTDCNVLRCYPNMGQLSVAIQCAVVLFKQGATFRYRAALFKQGAIFLRI
ncbi:hypothetical protein HYC85_030027 [Camellia sinensis]|uniref:Uncharacterized protein n=1 Tax=Camellia sinensis TaxID=4442 RepID=A0A7J7G3I8_CAMSI|nr:hypothetical protein HYC85_030027 [Camellia sinensis]